MELIWCSIWPPTLNPVGHRFTDTDLKQGTIATYNVLESMRCADVKNIAFASSSVVYGEASEMPTPETYGPLFPISLYGASKLGSEALITSWVGTFGSKPGCSDLPISSEREVRMV
ncbi:MAG: hypothetical protein Ct9H90mP16_22070 [Candidatus Poseidoniales archaeon]|nr:MAG: hypothetical protein Ct9H90mP16_22070 [Candidatus Poseidoniales archaeon]